MTRKFSLIPIAMLIVTLAVGQDLSLYKAAIYKEGNEALPYRIMYPENYDPQKSYPLVLFLHGAGECGTDNEKQLRKGAVLFADKSNRKEFPAFVVFPQCPFMNFWSAIKISFDSAAKKPLLQFPEEAPPTSAMKSLMGLTEHLLATLTVKRSQVYVGGLSMGGMGTFEIVKRMPGVFAAAFPICGGANPATADDLTTTSWWVFHGEKDPVVAYRFSEEMVTALKKDGALVKFTAYPEAAHNSWDSAFAEPDLLPWLFSQKLMVR